MTSALASPLEGATFNDVAGNSGSGIGGPGHRDTTRRQPRTSLLQHIAETVRAARLQIGMTQEELADRLRLDGLGWYRSAVAAVEAGERELTVTELLLVSDVLGVPIAEMLGAKRRPGLLSLGPVVRATSQMISDRLTTEHGELVSWGSLYADMDAQAEELGKIIEGMADSALAKRWRATPNQCLTAAKEMTHEAVVKAAKVLGRDPLEVALASVLMWNHGFVQERDRRLAERPDHAELSARSKQAIRGRITRDIVAELSERLPKFDEGAR